MGPQLDWRKDPNTGALASSREAVLPDSAETKVPAAVKKIKN